MDEQKSASPDKASQRIMVVDDEEKICLMLERYLSIKGYEVRSVRRGEEAVALSEVFEPGVVVLDLLMPGMNGIDTLKALKASNHPPKVIMLSAADHEKVIEGAISLGADFYLCKPVQLVELEKLINGFLPSKK